MISKELSKLGSVVGIFVNTKLEVLTKLFVELFEVFSVLADFLEELNALFGDIFLDDLKNLVVLEILSADVKRKIFRVNNTSDETKILGDKILAVVHDENSSDIELDIVLLLLGLEHIERSSLGNKDD